jgi:choline dehydrogenase
MPDGRAAFDVLVLGGGTAGCVLASRLSEDPGRSVCLVEGGPDYGPFDPDAGAAWPADMLDGRMPRDSHDWTDGESTLSAARIIGGCSSHNACAIMRGAPEDYDEWRDAGWSWAAIAPYLDRAEERLAPEFVADEAASPWFAAVCDAAAEHGLPVHEDLYAPGVSEGFGRVRLNIRGKVRWNAAFAYLDPARSRPNLTVMAETLVDRVLLDGNRAAGAAVVGPGGPAELYAPLVVLTAGAYGSPAILLRSGIGPEDELARHGIAARGVLPVGERLEDQFGIAVRFAPTERMERLIDESARLGAGAFCGLAKIRSASAPDGLWDLMLLPAAFPVSGDHDAPGGYVLSSSSMLMRPKWTGSVRLRDRDPGRLPVVTELSLGTGDDLARAMDGVELARRLARSDAAEGLVGEELAPGEGATTDEISARGRDALSAFFHPVGSCPMGAVVDGSGRVHGFEGLAIADGSIIPTIPRAGTYLTILALAEALSERYASGD